jgi:hypothetical protein
MIERAYKIWIAARKKHDKIDVTLPPLEHRHQRIAAPSWYFDTCMRMLRINCRHEPNARACTMKGPRAIFLDALSAQESRDSGMADERAFASSDVFYKSE